MMANPAYIKQEVRNLRLLVSQSKLKEAYQKCQALLGEFPKEKDLQSVLLEIEEKVSERNEKYINESLSELELLWSDKKYPEIIRQIKELIKVAPENKKLQMDYDRAKRAYAQQIEELQNQFFKKQRERLEELLANKHDQLESEIYQLEQNNPGNRNIKSLADEFRGKLVEKLLRIKRDFINSDNYDEIIQYLEGLKKISPFPERIIELQKKTNLRKHGHQLDEKTEYTYESLRQLRTLMKLKKFNEAIKACNELISFDPNNKVAKSYKKKAEEGIYRKTKSMVVEEIIANSKRLDEHFEQSPQDYKKI